MATALLAVSGLIMWAIYQRFPDPAAAELELYFITIYKTVTRLAKISFSWMVIAGVPRFYYFMEYDWSPMAGDLQVPTVIIMHIVMIFLVVMGILFWLRLGKRIRALKLKHNLG